MQIWFYGCLLLKNHNRCLSVVKHHRAIAFLNSFIRYTELKLKNFNFVCIYAESLLNDTIIWLYFLRLERPNYPHNLPRKSTYVYLISSIISETRGYFISAHKGVVSGSQADGSRVRRLYRSTKPSSTIIERFSGNATAVDRQHSHVGNINIRLKVPNGCISVDAIRHLICRKTPTATAVSEALSFLICSSTAVMGLNFTWDLHLLCRLPCAGSIPCPECPANRIKEFIVSDVNCYLEQVRSLNP
jgi:hypothetical protein